MRVHMTRKASVVFLSQQLWKIKRLLKVACSHLHRESGSVSEMVQDRNAVHTSRKCHVTYPFLPFPLTLNDLEGHSPIARFFKYSSTNICATFRTVSTDTTRRTVLQRHLSFLSPTPLTSVAPVGGDPFLTPGRYMSSGNSNPWDIYRVTLLP